MLGPKDKALDGYNVNLAEEAAVDEAPDDPYGLSAYEATDESVQALIEYILELEAYPDANRDELTAANNLLDNLLAQMDAANAEYDENYWWDEEAGIGYWYDEATGEWYPEY